MTAFKECEIFDAVLVLISSNCLHDYEIEIGTLARSASGLTTDLSPESNKKKIIRFHRLLLKTIRSWKD